MAHFRLAVLVCAGALACSGSEDGDAEQSVAMDPQQAVDVRSESADGAPESSAAASGTMPSGTMPSGSSSPTAAASPPGVPGLAAPSDVGAPPSDAERTASGLASKRLFVGAGARSPRPTDRVRVHYSGWQTNGMRFDSSVARGTPAEFPLNGVIAGWTEGLQLMVEGEERRFWIPEELAYRGRQAPFGMLVFDVQLISILP
jgi:FKBP-type peptidyl-prolyl cis-trans isomerase